MLKYFKRVEASKVIFLRVTKTEGTKNILVEDLEVVKMRYYERYFLQTQEIQYDEFTTLVKDYKLGINAAMEESSAPSHVHS